MKKLVGPFLILLIICAALLTAGYALIQGGDYLPAPTGPYPVGHITYSVVDPDRLEEMTPDPADHRELTVSIWYPALVDATARPEPYFRQSSHLGPALLQSGEVNRFELWGLGLVKGHAYESAQVATQQDRYPVVILSPGNATNAVFYTLLTADLASHGYIVAAIDHPYDDAAAALRDGSTAIFAADQWPAPSQQDAYLQMYRQRVMVRAADMRFVLDSLTLAPPNSLTARIDPQHIAAWGHSLGGIAAAQACISDRRFTACLNMDGLVAGLPYLPSDNGLIAPSQPFRYLGKPLPLPVSTDRLNTAIAAAGEGSGKVIVEGATHQSFSDSPLLMPPLFNPSVEQDRQLLATIRAETLAFFSQSLQ